MQEAKTLTSSQKRVLDFIRSFLQHKGYAPTLRDIALFLKTTNLSTAQYYVEQLEKRGHLTKEVGLERGIKPTSTKNTLPLLGFIAAGEPMEPIEEPIEITIPDNVRIDQRYPHYALKVKGNSMIDMGILDEDIVLIRHQLFADNGDVVVAITETGATLKVYKKIHGQVFLEPKNKDYPIINPKSLEVRGKFIGLIRSSP